MALFDNGPKVTSYTKVNPKYGGIEEIEDEESEQVVVMAPEVLENIATTIELFITAAQEKVILPSHVVDSAVAMVQAIRNREYDKL